LTWAQSTTSGVFQNKIYRALNSGGYSLYATINPAATSFIDKSTKKGTTYHYEVTACIANGGESSPSNAATAGY